MFKRIVLLGLIGFVIVGLLCVFTPFLGTIEYREEVATLEQGDTETVNGQVFSYQEDGTFIPGDCVTTSFGISSNTSSAYLDCDGDSYKVQFELEGLKIHILRTVFKLPLIKW